MGKLISKCCVCGRVYGSVLVQGDEEKVSHGYCSVICTQAIEHQVMFWDESLNCFNMDRAFEVNGKYYFRGQELGIYIVVDSVEVVVINVLGGRYNEEVVIISDNHSHKLRVAKEEAKKWNLNIITK